MPTNHFSQSVEPVPLTSEQCKSARLARDSRFDGRFFIAVKTTGIFCRPICPATTPKEENVEYFFHKAQALQAGYRPCLRCRPDSAPDSWAWLGTETTFRRALSLIEQGDLQHSSLPELAERLGISDRYLRKLFSEQLGMSPKQYAQYNQLMFAKQLLHHSSMTISDIALACGFNSIRRFNDACQKVLQLTPKEIRKNSRHSKIEQHSITPEQDASIHQLTLGFRPPFNWEHMLAFYRLRAISGIETVTSDSYQRSFSLNNTQGWFKATLASVSTLRIEFNIDDVRELNNMVRTIRRMFDLDADLVTIEEHLRLTSGFPVTSGIRIPGVWNTWEAGIRAILGQQVSIKAAITHLNNLTMTLNLKYNPEFQSKDIKQETLAEQGNDCVFPKPEWLVQSDLSFLKMPQSRKETLKRFAVYMSSAQTSKQEGARDNIREHPQSWLNIKGIGPWTVEYACIRGLSEPDHFLDTDLVVKKVLNRLSGIQKGSLSPWGSYATFHCWSAASHLTGDKPVKQNTQTTLVKQNKTEKSMSDNQPKPALKKRSKKSIPTDAQFYTYYESPLGRLTLQANDRGLLGLWLPIYTTQPDELGEKKEDHPILQQAVQQCQAYFAGTLQTFTVPLAAQGTVFQQQVWQALTTIPFGSTWSYQDLANAIGNPKAVRAVGLANGKNPISIIVPCHRVIGKNGKLTGYAGGIEQKEKLLKLEGVL